MNKKNICIVIGIGVLLFFSHIIGSVYDVASFIKEKDLAGIFILLMIVVGILALLMLETKDKRKSNQYLKIILALGLFAVCINVMVKSYPEQESSTTHHTYTTTHKTTTSNNSSSTTHSYSSSSSNHSDYDAEDYEDPQDFYDDHEGDFEDYEEAEDEWYDYN